VKVSLARQIPRYATLAGLDAMVQLPGGRPDDHDMPEPDATLFIPAIAAQGTASTSALHLANRPWWYHDD
jgi:hypothetical protein